jgi:hypothetical protein
MMVVTAVDAALGHPLLTQNRMLCAGIRPDNVEINFRKLFADVCSQAIWSDRICLVNY